MSTNLKWIVALAMIVTAFLVGRQTGREQVQAKWDAEKLVMAEAALKASEEYQAKERTWNKRLQEVQNAAIENEKKLQADNDSTLSKLVGLRNTNAALRSQLSRSTDNACAETASTILKLFGQCSEEYRELGKIAQGHANDVRALIDAWPD